MVASTERRVRANNASCTCVSSSAPLAHCKPHQVNSRCGSLLKSNWNNSTTATTNNKEEEEVGESRLNY